MVQEEGPHEAVVNLEREVGKRVKEKNGDDHPKDHVEEIVEEEPDERSAELGQRKEDPIVQVADVVVLFCTFEGEEGEISRDEVAGKARHQGISVQERRNEQKQEETCDDSDAGLEMVLLLDAFQGRQSIEHV